MLGENELPPRLGMALPSGDAVADPVGRWLHLNPPP